MKKLTLEQAKLEYAKHGFELLDVEWKSAEKPHKCKDSNGYLYNKTLSNIRQIGIYNQMSFNKPFDTRNEYYWENVLHYMTTNVDNNTLLLSNKSDFTSANSKLSFQCGECGKIFHRTWKSFINLDNKICTNCYKNMRPYEPYIEKRRNDIDKYILAANQIGLKILDNRIDSTKSKINVEDSEGYRGIICASRLLKGSNFEKWSTYRNPYIKYNLQKFINKQGFKSKVLKVNKDDVLIECECGEQYNVSKDHLIYGCQCVCKKCTKSMSLLERTIECWLNEHNIQYIEQKTFDNLVGIGNKALRFDFYIPEHNACIEVNGRQHYQDVRFDGQTFTLDITQEHDKRKRQYCKNNDIALIEIPYWDISKNDNYKDILNTFFSIKK